MKRPAKSRAVTPGVADAGDAAPHYLGHRERLRDRFVAGGEAAVSDYELIELVLFRAIPRVDVKPLAKELIRNFGGFGAALTAADHLLLEIKGMTRAAITEFRLVHAASLRLSRAHVMKRPVISSWTALLDYVSAALANERKEQFRVLFLDRKNVLIADEVQQKGTVDHTPVYPREVVSRALELGASAVILVHNHPSGDPKPSREDIEMTREIAAAAKPLRITVHDHLIVGKGAHASFKSLGLL